MRTKRKTIEKDATQSSLYSWESIERHLEDSAEAAPQQDVHEEDMPEFVGIEPTMGQSLEYRLAGVIRDGRTAALEVIDKVMVTTLCEVMRIIHDENVDKDAIANMSSTVEGFSRYAFIELMGQNFDTIDSYVLEKCRNRYMIQFLDVSSIQKASLKEAYPNAFKKWDAREEVLLKEYISSGLSWREISQRLLRNINAVKLRAEKLALVTDTGARARF